MDALTSTDWGLIYGCAAIHITAIILIFRRWRRSKESVDPTEVLLVLHAYLILLFVNYGVGVALLDVNRTSRVIVERGLLSRHEAAAIVRVSEEEAASRGAWSSDRHASYPTTDIDISTVKRAIKIGREEEDFHIWTLRMVQSRVLPKLSAAYKVQMNELAVKELFVVKYDADAQRSLSEHQDAAMITFNIALSDRDLDYTGGGTEFVLSGDVINIGKGDMLTHESGVSHCGHDIISGTRYILIGLINVAPSSSSNSISGQHSAMLHNSQDSFKQQQQEEKEGDRADPSAIIPYARQGKRLWWRGYGSTASCLILPVDAIINNNTAASGKATTTTATSSVRLYSNVDANGNEVAYKKVCINIFWPYWRKLQIPLGEILQSFRSGSMRRNRRVEDGSINDTGTNKTYVRVLVATLGFIGLAMFAFTIYMGYVIWDEHIRSPVAELDSSAAHVDGDKKHD